MILIQAHREGWDCCPGVPIHAAVTVVQQGKAFDQLLWRQHMATQQQLQFQALLGSIHGIWNRPGQGHVAWAEERCGLPQLV